MFTCLGAFLITVVVIEEMKIIPLKLVNYCNNECCHSVNNYLLVMLYSLLLVI